MRVLPWRFGGALVAAVAGALLVLILAGELAFVAVTCARAPVVVEAPVALVAAGLLLPSVILAIGPLAVLAGVVGLTQRWAEEGALLGLQSAGIPIGALRPPVILLSVGVGLGLLGLGHGVEPAARAALRERLEALAGAPTLAPGTPVNLGGALILARSGAVGAGEDVLFAAGSTVAVAQRAAVEAPGALHLETGELLDLDHPDLRVAFAEGTLNLPAVALREEAVERSTPALIGLIDRMEGRGRSAEFERMILWRRSAAPLLAPALGLGGLVLGARARRPVVGALGLLFGSWLLTRLADQAVGLIGGPAAGLLPAFLLLGLAVLAQRSLR